jgi:O-antigen/teichoic acid export membrane protein
MTSARNPQSLTQRTSRGIGFRLVGNLMQVILSLLLGVILARLLSPKEFGLFGFAAATVAITEIIGSFGMLRALVYKQNLTLEHEAAGGALQLIGSMAMGSLLVLSAPIIEQLFDMEGLDTIMLLQASVLVIHSMALLPTSRLTRHLAFKQLAGIEISTYALGGVCSILFALHGMGALALASGNLVSALSLTTLLWIYAPGRIPLTFRLTHIRDLLRYGVGFFGIDLAGSLARQAVILVIGHQLGIAAVGLYRRAFQLVMLPLQQITGSAHKVLFPAMASVQDQDQRFQRGYLGLINLSALTAFPLLTFIATTADQIIPLVYGPMWTDTIPILQVLALSGYWRIVNNAHGLVLQSRGRGLAEAARQWAYFGLSIIFAYIGGRAAGILGAVIGISSASFVFFVSMTPLALSVSGVAFTQLLLTLRTGFVGSVAMGMTVLGMKAVLAKHMSIGPLWMIVSGCSILVYIILLRLLLTVEERRFMESVSRILPPRFEGLFRLFLGNRSGSSCYTQ